MSFRPHTATLAAARGLVVCGAAASPARMLHRLDIHELDTPLAWGAQRSLHLDFSDVDRVPTLEPSEITWKNGKGVESPMPAPTRRFHPERLSHPGLA